MNEAYGDTKAPILFVMVAPPSDRMFSWFWKKLAAAGIKKTDCRIVYMLDEQPKGSSYKPLKGQLVMARERFEREILASKPKVIAPMGTEAFQVLTGIKESIFDARGYIIEREMFFNVQQSVWQQVGTYKTKTKKGAMPGDPKMGWVKMAVKPLAYKHNVPVIPLFTLDHIRTEAFAVAPVLKQDLLRIQRVARGELKKVDENFSFALTLKELHGYEWGEIIAVDIETHGIDNEVIDLISFSDGMKSCSLEWDERVRAYTEKIFALPKRIFAVHNSPFDIPRLRAAGVKISQQVIERQIFDTMFGAVTLQPDLHKSLGRVTSLYLDCSPWKSSSRNEKSPWRLLSREKPREYSAKDAFFTALLCMVEMATMKKLGVWNLFMGEGDHPGPGIMATIPVLVEMTRFGVPINKPYVKQWAPRLEHQIRRYENLWAKHFPGVNPHAPAQLKKLFFNAWGLPPIKTRDDTVTTDELALVSLSAFVEAQRSLKQHPGPWQKDPRCNKRTFDLLLKLRERSKILGTYVEPVFLEEKPRVHPNYLPVSKDAERGPSTSISKGNTATGRLATSNPNLANQPKETRVLYVPDEETHCFIEADFKSAELFVQGAMAGDEILLSDLKGDIHQINADEFGIPRKIGKNVTYASQYLATPAKQSEMILRQQHIYVSPAQCYAISEKVWSKYAKTTAYKQHLIHLCDTKRFLVNAFGRPRVFHDGRSSAAVNFIPQSTVADILWCVLKPVSDVAKKYGGRIYTTVYDSVLIAVPKANRYKAARAMKKAMEQRFDNIVPGFFIPVELKMAGPGEPWSAVKEFTFPTKKEKAA